MNKKKWLYPVAGAILAALVFLFFKFPEITAIALAVCLFAAGHILYKKKFKYYYAFEFAGFLTFVLLGIFSDNVALVKVLFVVLSVGFFWFGLKIDQLNKELKGRR